MMPMINGSIEFVLKIKLFIDNLQHRIVVAVWYIQLLHAVNECKISKHAQHI